MKTSSHMQIWSRHWLPLTMIVNKTNLTMCANHKGSLDSTLFEQHKHYPMTNVFYFTITHFKGSKMFIHGVLTFHKIFNLFVSMILASLMNSKCCLGELEKYEYNDCKKSFNFATMGKFDKSWTSRFISWVMQYCPIM